MERFVKSLVFVICILLLTGLLTTSSRANENLVEGQPSISKPMLMFGAFINIWLETPVDNIQPRIAYNSRHDEYLVVWTNVRGGGATLDIYARRVRGDGTVLSNFTITHNANFYNYDPDVVYNPLQDEYLVVWTYDSISTDSDIWARRISWNGADLNLPDYAEFQLGRPNDKSGKQMKPAVAYNGAANEYLVVYENYWGNSSDIDAVRVRAGDGVQVGWRNIATHTGQFRGSPDVAYHPGSDLYLVAYDFQTSSTATTREIYGKRATWNLGELSPEIEICVDGNEKGSVALAVSPEDFLAVWDSYWSGGATSSIYARRLALDGTPLGPIGGFLVAGTFTQINEDPDVAYAGGSYQVVWYRVKSGKDYDVLGRFVSMGKDISLGNEFFLDNDVSVQKNPAVACNSLWSCLMVEEDGNSAGGDYEIHGRLIWRHFVFLPLIIKN